MSEVKFLRMIFVIYVKMMFQLDINEKMLCKIFGINM